MFDERVIIFLLILPLPTCPIEESFCFGSSYDDGRKTGLGLISMGASQWYGHPVNTFWAANHLPLDLTTDEKPILTIRRVKGRAADETKMVELNGWLYIEIKRKKTINAAAIWVLTDKMETFGQFMAATSRHCSGPGKSPSIVPCSATPVDTPLNPNMFIWTYLNGALTQRLGLLWKADMSYCNMPKSLKFVIAISPSKWSNSWPPIGTHLLVKDGATRRFGPLLYQSHEMEPAFYGAASPVFDMERLDCSSDADDVSYNNVTWMKNKPTTPVIIGLDSMYYDDRWDSSGNEKTTVVIKRSVCKAADNGYISFGGRCSGTNWDTVNAGRRLFASTDSPPICNNRPDTITDADLLGKFEQSGSKQMHLKDYVVGKRKGNVHKLPCGCPIIPTETELKGVASSRALDVSWEDSVPYLEPERGCKEYAGKPEYHLQGLCLLSAAGQYSLGVRKWHTIANLLNCMVIIPISLFMARYLKGAIPIAHGTGTPHLPVQLWYMFHMLLVLPSICLYATGIAAIRRQVVILGASRSEYAKFHRISGIVIMTVFGIQCISGFLRPLKMTPRKIAIYLHWGFGYMVHYFGAIICVLTYRIPASPFTFHRLWDPNFNLVFYHVAPLIVLIWLIIDVIYHVSVTMYMKSYDEEKLRAKRPSYFPVILPMPVDTYYLRTHDYDDLPHEGQCLLRISYSYAVFCVTFFILTMIAMSYLNFELNHGYGPMECTHNWDNKFTAGSDNVSNEELKERHQFCHI